MEEIQPLMGMLPEVEKEGEKNSGPSFPLTHQFCTNTSRRLNPERSPLT